MSKNVAGDRTEQGKSTKQQAIRIQ